MKQIEAFKIVYTGNHTGKFYSDNLVGVAKSEDEAKELLNEILKEDLETYSDIFSNATMVAEYDVVKREVTTNELPMLLPAYPVSSYKLTVVSKDRQYADDTYMYYRIEKISYLTLD